VAAILEGESLALHSRRSNSAASAALEAKVRTSVTATANGEIAASAPRSTARFDFAATVAAAMNLSGALVAAMPAISAGLCARRRRNRQCGDARGKE